MIVFKESSAFQIYILTMSSGRGKGGKGLGKAGKGQGNGGAKRDRKDNEVSSVRESDKGEKCRLQVHNLWAITKDFKAE